MVLTLSDSLSRGHMLGNAPRSQKRGDGPLGGRQHKRPSFSPLPQPSQWPEGHTAEATFPHQPPIPHRQEAGKTSQSGILGAAIRPKELEGSARLCIRELTMRSTQGKPEMGARSQAEPPALGQELLEFGPA